MQNKKGFTLIELMIVVAIIAILAMIAVPMYQNYMQRARNTAAQSLLKQLATAQVAYSVDNNTFVVGTIYSPIEDGDVTANSPEGIELLATSGFRPDPNVGFWIAPATGGFRLYAAHTQTGSQVYVYDEVAGGGVRAVTATLAGELGLGTPPSPLYTWKTESVDPTTGNPAFEAGSPATIPVSLVGGNYVNAATP
ncbi:MAG: type IV pilin protein, partial [Candidatus Adiutrix sp.]